MGKSKPVLAIDFDGTLHHYTGWNDGEMNGPNPGAVKFVTEAMEHFTVVVVSSRCNDAGGSGDIAAWLEEHGFPYVQVTAKRPPAWACVDDRAFQFRGVWPTMDDLLGFTPWWKQ